MKKIISLLIFFPCLLSAQDYNKMYYSENWKGTSMEKAKYYRVSGFNDSLLAFDGKVEDFIAKNNNLEMSGNYENGKKNGVFTFYFSNGNTRLVANYLNGIRNGKWKEYYSNGTLKLELNYIDEKELLLNFNDADGKSMISDGKIVLKQNGLYIKGSVLNNLRSGNWKIQSDEYGTANLKYKEGKLVKGTGYFRNKKRKITDNLAYPLIDEPDKFFKTENFSFEYGAKIKNNYVLEGLHKHKYLNAKKIEIHNQEELEKLILSRLDITNPESEQTIKIILSVENSIPVKCETVPKISKQGQQELELIIGLIERISFTSNDIIYIDYKIKKDNRLGNT